MPNPSRRTFLASTAGVLAGAACSTPSPRPATADWEPFERERFVEEVRRALPGGQAAVDEVIARAVARPVEVVREFGAPDERAADLLYRDADLSIFNIVLPPNSSVAPHDHLMWASIGVYAGREDNIMWRRAGESITQISTASLGVKDVFSLPADAIHSMTNPGAMPTAAIHVYGGDLLGAKANQWDPETLRSVARDGV